MSQPHYNLKYSVMELSFDLGGDLFIYNVGKYLTRDKGTPLEDAQKAVELLKAYRPYLPTSVVEEGFSGAWVDNRVQRCFNRFCNQFSEKEGVLLGKIFYHTHLRQLSKAIKLIEENYLEST